MKKILLILTILGGVGLFGVTTFASTAVPWSITNLTDPFILPTLVNGSTKGIIVSASSTIGSGSRTGGLTINGGATTTGVAYFAGNIGVGITNPGVAVDVVGKVQASTGFNVIGNVVTLLTVNNVNAINRNTASGNQLQFGNDTASGFWQSLAFYTGVGSGAATEKLRIDTSGNVGIGTTSPYAKLSIHAQNGDTNTTLFTIASSTASATTTLFSVSNTGAISGASGNFLVNSGGTITTNGNIILGSGGTITSGVSQNLTLAANNFAQTAITIQSGTGNVGVASTSPFFKLSVGTGNVGTFGISTTTSGCAQFSGNGEVYSTGTTCGGTGTNYFTLTGNSLQNNSGTALGINTAPNFANLEVQASTTNANPFALWNSVGGSLLVVKGTGNVGIGTASPIYPLQVEVNNGATTPTLLLHNTNGSVNVGSALAFGNFSSGNNTVTSQISSIRTNLVSSGDSDLAFLTYGSGTLTEKARLLSSGNFGIGTTSPFASLSVQINNANGIGYLMTGTPSDGSAADNQAGVALVLTHNVTGNRQFALADSQSGNGVRFAASAIDGYNYLTGARQNLGLGTNSTDVSITGGANNLAGTVFKGTTGLVGIGTTSPYAQLSVATAQGATGSITTLFAIASSTASATTTLFSVSNTGQTVVGGGVANSSYALTVNTSNTNALFVSGQTFLNGNTFLGTVPVSSFLATSNNGNIIATTSPQPAGNYITALTGDGTASGPGSAALTLATVNGNVGSFTNANVTVNAKGLITAVSNGSGGSSFDEAWKLDPTKSFLIPTTTLGVIVSASSTIGNGNQNGGLTINGGATTTGNQYIKGMLGVGTNVPAYNVQVMGTAPNSGFTGILTNDSAFTYSKFLIGFLKSSDGTYGEPGIWLGDNATTPSFSNYTLNTDPTFGNIFNSPFGQLTQFRINNSTIFTAGGNGLAIGTAANTAPTYPFQVQTASSNFVVLSSGNTGVGTTSPYAQFSLNAPAGTAPYFAIGSTTSEVFKIVPSSNPFMGIGTTSPFATLSVNAPAGISPFVLAGNAVQFMQIDSKGHLITGGSSPTCGTGCASVTGDDRTMRIVAGSAVTVVTVNFANTYTTSPICIGTEDETGLNAAVDASTTPTTVQLTISATISAKHLGVICQNSANFTY